jgi:hypothetical protein
MYRTNLTANDADCGCSGGRSAGRGNSASTRPASGGKPERAAAGGGKGCDCGCGGCERCEGLVALCRPRFFDGQLITAADFSRLDRYIVQKDRLHNRYLHGVGVVCGLEAVCSACDDTVTVRPGYALGPCGEDIVVPCDARVDVAALIKEQRRRRPRDCGPYARDDDDCEAARQKWVLSVCYDERAARPVTNLRPREDKCGGCGGSGSGGCGCGGSAQPSSAPSNCEPSQMCEGFRFTLTKLAPERKGSAQGELPTRVAACLKSLRDAITSIPSSPTSDDLVEYCCELKDELRDAIDAGTVYDCTLGQRLGQVVCPDPEDQDASQKARVAIAELLTIAIEIFRACICSAQLPPCPVGSPDDCVPLAVLTVRSSDLRVLDICNWSQRKFVVTMPTLSYWFGWIPIFGAFRDVIVRLCCEPVRRPKFRVDERLRVNEVKRTRSAPAPGFPEPPGPAEEPVAVPFFVAQGQPAAEAAGAEPEAGAPGAAKAPADEGPTSFVSLGMQYARALSSLSGLEATVLGALGAQTPAGQALASPLELANPLAAFSLAQVAVPAGASLLPPELLARIGGLRRGTTPQRAEGQEGQEGEADEPVAEPVAEPAAEPVDRIAVLEAALTRLQRKVDTQARTIRTMQKKGPEQ